MCFWHGLKTAANKTFPRGKNDQACHNINMIFTFFFCCFNLGFYAGNWETTSQEKIMLREKKKNICQHNSE